MDAGRSPCPIGLSSTQTSVVGEFLHHPIVEPTAVHLLQAIDLAIAHVLSLWDALIVAAAASAGCRILYSEDLSPGSTIGTVRLVNPFA